MINFPSFPDHSLIWIFGIVLPFLSGLQSEKLRGTIQFDASSRKKLYLGNSIMLAISGSTVLVLWLIKNRSFSELGFTKSIEITPMVWGIISLFVIAYLLDLFITLKELNKSNGIKEKDWFEKSSFLPEKIRELPAYILLCICAGVFEEIIYRGFMVTYFLRNQDGTTFPIIAIMAPSILFSLAHYYQGWSSVVKIFIFASLLSGIFIVSKSIYPTMVLHFLIDLTSGLIIMKKNKHKTQ